MVTVRYLAALLLAAAAVILCAPAAYGQVLLNDKADLYSDEQETSIISMMEDASEKTGWNFGIVTLNVDYSSGEAARSRAEKIYDETFGRDSSGVLFLCDVGYRHFVIAGDAEKYVSGRRFDKMVSRIKTLYFDYDDMGCARTFVNSVVDCYNMGELKVSEKISGTAVITAVFIGLVAAGVACCIVIHIYKTYPKTDAGVYMDAKKSDIYTRNDIFLRQFTTSHTNSSSGGGGGGHHGGGGFGGHR